MQAKGTGAPPDDCFAKFDEAFARLEANMVAAERPKEDKPNPPPADLSEYEEAFADIDRQLAAQPEPATTPVAPIASAAGAASAAPGPAAAVPSSLAPAAPVAASAEPQSPEQTGGSSRASLALVLPASGTASDTSRAHALTYYDADGLWLPPTGGGTPLERLVGTIQNLQWLQRSIQGRTSRLPDRVRWEQVGEIVSAVRQLCSEFDLPTASVRVEFALTAFDEGRHDSLAIEVGELVRHLRHDLQACSIAPIPRERVWGFTLSLDERAHKAFPTAANEVAEAGRCIGFGVYGATAFHLLRAAEYGRRAVARAVRFDERDAEAEDWATTITALQTRMLDLAGWPAGPARKAVKNFLTALLSDARDLEEARRRLAEGAVFQECHAVALWYSTRDFLTLAAERVSEARDALLTPDDFIPRT